MIVGQEVTAAMKLQDLYYGNVIPCQLDFMRGKQFASQKTETRSWLRGHRAGAGDRT